METITNDYLSREIVQDPALLPLGNATSLLETGNPDLVAEHFAGVAVICAYLRSRAGGRTDQACAHG